MGIYIKGMKMPKDCPIRITLYPNGQVVKANAIDYEEFESVSVPPHGRLIDADKIPWRYGTWDTDFDYVIKQQVNMMPTIILADKEVKE